MILGKKVAVVLPAYNAAGTIEKTYSEIPFEIVDQILLVDDASQDNTVEIAKSLGIPTFFHSSNRGYGANQKTCYREALKLPADIFVMLHPDYQYTPKLIPAVAGAVASEKFDMVLGSRILGGTAISGGMPIYKYIANRFLTFFENLLIQVKLSEYHTGYRAFSRRLLETLPLLENSDDFVFDNQIIVQALYFGFRIGEVSCPASYCPEASSISFSRSVNYGIGVLKTAFQFRLQKLGLLRLPLFDPKGRKLSECFQDSAGRLGNC